MHSQLSRFLVENDSPNRRDMFRVLKLRADYKLLQISKLFGLPGWLPVESG